MFQIRFAASREATAMWWRWKRLSLKFETPLLISAQSTTPFLLWTTSILHFDRIS